MANPFYIQPAGDFMAGIGAIGEALDTRAAYARQKAKQTKEENDKREAMAKEQALRQKALQIFQGNDPTKMAEFMISTPGAEKILDPVIKFKDEETRKNMVETAMEALSTEDPKALTDTLLERAEYLKGKGADYAGTLAIAEKSMTDPAGAKARIKMGLAYTDPKLYSSLYGGGISGDPKIGAQKIYADGTLIQSTPGGPIVYDNKGNRVTGEEAAQAVERARAEEVRQRGDIKGTETTAGLESQLELKGKVAATEKSQVAAAEMSNKALDRLDNIKTNIRNLDEGINLLRKDGANTGVIDKYLPSFKEATIRLDNLQGRLGLDVLRNTTFGALSASELRFALNTAVPKGLQPKDLADWLEEQKTAQEKLANYIESAAIYLGTPGNTISGWIQEQRSKREAQEEAQQGQAKKRRVFNPSTGGFE